MEYDIVYSQSAPKPVGPYSQAIRAGDMLFISGQIPIDAVTGTVVGESIEEQTIQVIANIKAILAAQGLDSKSLVKTTVYMKDLGAFSKFNTTYEKEIGNARPARSVVGVSELPKNVLVEIEAIACR